MQELIQELKQNLRKDILNHEPSISLQELEDEVNSSFQSNYDSAKIMYFLIQKKGFRVITIDGEMIYIQVTDDTKAQLKHIVSEFYVSDTNDIVVIRVPVDSWYYIALVENETSKLYDTYITLIKKQ